MGDMPEKALADLDVVLAEARRDADAIAAVAVTSGLVALGFGVALIHTWFTLGDVFLIPAYQLITELPGWPATVGVVLAVAGTGQIAAHLLGRDAPLAVVAANLFAAVVWSAYCGMYVVGTILWGGLWGPQAIYAGLAVVAALIARRASRRRRVVWDIRFAAARKDAE